MSIHRLDLIRELLSDPARWTKGADARDEQGTPVAYDSATATCWCLYGALSRTTPAAERYDVGNLLRAATRPLALAQFNDQAHIAGRHDELLAAIDRAKEMTA